MNVSNHLCKECGRKGDIVVGEPIREKSVVHVLAAYCRACGLRCIPQLPRRKRIVIVVPMVTGYKARTRRKKYTLISFNEVANTAELASSAPVRRRNRRAHRGSGNELQIMRGRRSGARRYLVRFDAVPEEVRAAGSAFEIIGIPLEIKLFERSGKRDIARRGEVGEGGALNC